MFAEDDPILLRLREVCAALPECTERVSHGRPVFRAGETGRIFALYGAGVKVRPGVHERHDHALIFRPDPVDAEALGQDPRFFSPAYYGPFGWLGVDLDDDGIEWAEVAELVDASYRLLAPIRLVRVLDGLP